MAARNAWRPGQQVPTFRLCDCHCGLSPTYLRALSCFSITLQTFSLLAHFVLAQVACSRQRQEDPRRGKLILEVLIELNNFGGLHLDECYVNASVSLTTLRVPHASRNATAHWQFCIRASRFSNSHFLCCLLFSNGCFCKCSGSFFCCAVALTMAFARCALPQRFQARL